jgi:uncharacterized protein
MNVASNTGPLIALAKIDRMVILERLFDKVLIPAVVHRELLAKSGDEADRLDQALAAFVQVAQIIDRKPEVIAATQGLDVGERDAVALAHQTGLSLIIDDRVGRRAARQLGVSVTGVAGVLIQARKWIASVRQELEMIRDRGYWLSDELIDTAASLAGE